jgi:transposase
VTGRRREPSEIDVLRSALAAAEARAAETEAKAAEAARERAVLAKAEVTIAALRLEIEKLRRAIYGTWSDCKARQLDQLELQLEEFEATAPEDDLAAERLGAPPIAAAPTRERRHAVRKPFPAHLPRERVVVPAPSCCEACGSGRIVRLGEDVTETLEVIPRRWKVVQTVREKFTRRDCERISQPPAPFHPTPRGRAGPNLLATTLFEKFGQHQPLNRQAERYAREGVALSLSTLADQVGACAAALAPLHDWITAHVLTAEDPRMQLPKTEFHTIYEAKPSAAEELTRQLDAIASRIGEER